MSKYKHNRRSLQSSFVINVDDNTNDLNLEDRDILISSHTPINSPTPNTSSPTMNNWTMNPKRASLYGSNNNSNVSLNVPKNHHRRKSSAAAESYIPPQMVPPPPIQPSPSPFKFGSTNVSSESLNVPTASFRRGHRYKHSSVSMNLFQEAPKPIVKNVPQTYKVPTFEDIKGSITSEQKFKIGICCCQLLVLMLCYIFGTRLISESLVTLSHILFYDFISNLITLLVQVLANFPIWKTSSLIYPFGLGRIEVLCSYGLSVSLMFVGLDLVSHLIEELVMEVISIDEGSTHLHDHANGTINVNFFVYEIIILAVVAISMYTSHTVNSGPKEQEISVVKRLSSITLNSPSRKPLTLRLLNLLGLSIMDDTGSRNVMSSSTTLLTVLYSAYCMIYPLLGNELVNKASTFALSILILFIGWVLIKRYAYTLLLGTQLEDVEHEIKKHITQLDCYRNGYAVNSVKVARVNHLVWVIIIELNMLGSSDDEEAKMRFYASRVVRGVMQRSVNNEKVEQGKDDRGNLLDLMSGGEVAGGSQFEITFDIVRL